MRGKVLIVVAALLLGGIAAYLTFGYLGGLQRQATAGSELVTVYRAREDIERGALASGLIANGLVEIVDMPKRYVPEGAISSADGLADRVLSGSLSKGEILTAGRFQYASDAGLAFSVPEGLVAVTIPVDDARGVAGLISPGDHVAVLATLEDNTNQISYTRVIVGGVQVLAVGQNTGSSGPTPSGVQSGGVVGAAESGSAASSSVTIVTVAASAADAERIVYGVEVGSIWLALLPDKDEAVERGPGQHELSVFK